MKSIVEEGSSIFKAIEKGWTRAGKPSHFSVKIFELPEKNFFGMTTKQAKVGIMFEHDLESSKGSRHSSQVKKSTPQPHVAQKKHHNVPVERVQGEKQGSSSENVGRSQEKQQADQAKKKVREPRKPDVQKEREKKGKEVPAHHNAEANQTPEIVDLQKKATELPLEEKSAQAASWTNELVDVMKVLVKESMAELGFPNIESSYLIDQAVLRVTFSSPVLDNPVKEKQFFQNYAFLLIALLKTQSKSNVRSLRLFLSSERQQVT